MVHDRRIDGKAVVFGNASSLFMSAMTWFDHETNSIWSQPWGRAIRGPQKGVVLHLLPSQVTTWANWRAAHPRSLVMTDDIDLMPNFRQAFREDFVIGVVVDGSARAYPYTAVVAAGGVVNDAVGQVPVLIWASGGDFAVYGRVADGDVLSFSMDDDRTLVDAATGSYWDPSRGLATAGPLQGEILPSLPRMTAFADHWFDFYPQSSNYNGGDG